MYVITDHNEQRYVPSYRAVISLERQAASLQLGSVFVGLCPQCRKAQYKTVQNGLIEPPADFIVQNTYGPTHLNQQHLPHRIIVMCDSDLCSWCGSIPVYGVEN